MKKTMLLLLTGLLTLNLLTGCVPFGKDKASEPETEIAENIPMTKPEGNLAVKLIEFETEETAHSHDYTALATPATCAAAGYVTYTCACGESYRGEDIPETEHSYQDKVVTPTQSAQGYTVHTCKVCGYAYKDSYTAKLPVSGETAAKHDHTYTARVVAPTCTAKGYTVYTCGCGNAYVGNETAALEHAYESAVVKATETAQGYTLHTCKICGSAYKDAYTAPTHTHQYSNTVIAPTCTEKGYTNHTCACGNTYTNASTDALGHDYTAEVVAPTIFAKGYTLHTCSRCGNSYKDTYVGALHTHSYKSAVVAPTCTTPGYTQYTCACGDTYKDDEKPSMSHDYNATVVAPTTTAKGYTLYTCRRCGDSFKDTYTDMLHSHKYTDTVVAPTCLKKGYTQHVCACGDAYMDTATDALGHAYTTQVVAPTETVQGYTLHTCSRCGSNYKDNYTDPVSGPCEHNYRSTHMTRPECTEVGYEWRQCTKCGDEYRETLPATGHSWTVTENDATHTAYRCASCGQTKTEAKEPGVTDDTVTPHVHGYTATTVNVTCTSNGYVQYTCVCGDSYTDNEVAALSHSYVPTLVPATTTERGYTLYTCIHCGYSYKDNFTNVIHNHKYDDAVVAPTCTAKGYTRHVCGCGDVYSDAPVDELGHNYSEQVVNPTETDQGYTLHICSRCNDSYKDNYVDPIVPPCQHNYEIIDTSSASCAETGHKLYQCRACGDEYRETIPATGHSWTVTENDTAHTAYECENCGQTKSETKATDAYSLINAERAAHGLPALSYYSEGMPAAETRLIEIQSKFAHERPDGTYVDDLTSEMGLSRSLRGENLGKGYYSDADIVEAWMNSPGHRANILDSTPTAITIAEVNGYWVMLTFF